MAERVDRWTLDISPLIRALEEGQTSVEDLDKAIKEMGESMDSASTEAVEGAEEVGESAKDAGDSTEQGAKKGTDAWKVYAAGAVAAAAAVYKVVDSVVALSADANQFAKDAKVLGTTAEDVQTLQGAFDLLTDGTGNAVISITKLQRATAEARDGVGEYADSFAKLGIEGDAAIQAFASAGVRDQILAIAAGMENVQDRADKTQIAMDLLGRSGAKLIPAFAGGGAAIAEAMAQIEDAGVISNETAKASEDLQDAILLMNQSFITLKSDVLTPLIPLIEEGASKLAAMMKEARDSEEIKDLAQALLDLGESLSGLSGDGHSSVNAVIWVLKKLVQSIDATIDTAVLLKDVVVDVVQIIAQFGGVVLGADTALVQWGETFKETSGSAKGLINSLGELFAGTKVFKDEAEEVADVLEVWPDAWGIGIDALVESEKELKTSTKAATEAIEEQIETFKTLGMSADLVQQLTTETTEREAGNRIRMYEDEADVQLELQRMVSEYRSEEARKFSQEQQRINAGLVSSAVTSWGIIGNAIGNTLEQGSKDAKKFAKVQLGITSALTIAESAMNLIAAGASWAAGSKTWQEGLAVIGIAAAEIVASAVAIGAAESGASFHTGGIIGDVNFTAQEGEAVINRRAVQEIGPEGVDRINRGGDTGGGKVVVIDQTNNRTTAAREYEIIRTGNSPYSRLIQGLQPTRVGLSVIGAPA